MAPGAELISGKVLDDDGFGQDSAIIAGMEWAVEQGAKDKAAELGVDLVVLSPPEESDVQSQISQVEDQLAARSGHAPDLPGARTSQQATAERAAPPTLQPERIPQR